MKFNHFSDVDNFKDNILDILLEKEVENNLLISILTDSSRENSAEWLLATVTGDNSEILLISICTKPFNLLLSKPSGTFEDGSVDFLANELKRINFIPPGVIAEKELAQLFSEAYCSNIINTNMHMTMTIMKLDKLSEYKKAPGFCRVLTEKDLSFTPDWERAFSVDCQVPVFSLDEYRKRIETRLGRNIHYIWEDDGPVAQAVWGRNTPNSAAVSWVYTPPEHRGKGYATSVVAELSNSILKSGKTSCCLFADASNPVSQGVYRKLGYYEVCRVDEIKFDIR